MLKVTEGVPLSTGTSVFLSLFNLSDRHTGREPFMVCSSMGVGGDLA